MLQAELKVVGGKHHGKLIPLGARRFLIGREQDCHLRPNSELVSRHHCVFAIDDFAVRLRDLGSTNGTYVNDERLRGEVSLKDGDRIHIGKLDFEIRVRTGVAAEQPLVAAPGGTGDSTPQIHLPQPAALAETQLASGETAYDLPVPPSLEDSKLNIGGTVSEGDTTVIFTLAEQEKAMQAAQQAAAQPQQAPPPPPPQAPQPQWQPAEQYAAPSPYPQPQYGYGMQTYPYGAPPMPFPQYPQYPSMYPPAMPFPAPSYSPQPQAPPPPSAPPAPSQSASEPMVKLPAVGTTGAHLQQPPPAPPADPNAPKKTDSANPSLQAADIIKQYIQRRPTPGA